MDAHERQEFILLAHDLKRVLDRVEKLIETASDAARQGKLAQAQGDFISGVAKLGEL